MALRDIYLTKAQQARDTVAFAYRRGGLSLLDFLDAQRSYRETSLEYLRALGATGARCMSSKPPAVRSEN